MVLATSRGLPARAYSSLQRPAQLKTATRGWRWVACVLVAAAIVPLVVPADSNAATTSYLQLKNRATGLCLSTYATRNPSPVFQKPCGSGWETRWAECNGEIGPCYLGNTGLAEKGLLNGYSGLWAKSEYNGSGLDLWTASTYRIKTYGLALIGNEGPGWYWIKAPGTDTCVSVDSFASFDHAFEWYCLAQNYDAQTWKWVP